MRNDGQNNSKQTGLLGLNPKEFLKREEIYRKLIELSPDMIFVQTEGKFVLINPAGIKFLGAYSEFGFCKKYYGQKKSRRKP